MNYPELAVSCLLIGHLDDNEYLTVDSATLLHCPGSDNDDSYCCSVEAHLCLAPGILSPQHDVCLDAWSTVTAETLILRLSALLKQLLLARLKTDATTYHSRTNYVLLCFFIDIQCNALQYNTIQDEAVCSARH